MSCDGSAIASAVYNLYESLGNNGKPKGNEFSVLSAVIEETNSTLRVVTLTTGTKCIGQEQDNSLGNMISDSHAEVLGKRAFTLYLLNESVYPSNMTCPLETYISSEGETKYRIKDGFKYHLFISDSPCGDASIYARSTGVNFTGAKLVSSDVIREGVQDLGSLRTKSGRSTIEEKNRTTSLSCSDKICRWQALGCLGAVASKAIDPVYFSSIIIGADPLSNTENQMNALKRALHDRMISYSSIIKKLPVLSIVDFSMYKQSKCHTEYNYQQQIQTQSPSDSLKLQKPQPCGTSINWIINTPNDMRKSTKCTATSGGTVEVTLAHLGARQGATKKSVGTAEASSRLCRRKIAERYLSLIQMQPNLNISVGESKGCKEISYLALKKSSVEYLTARTTFLSCSPFDKWPCDECVDFKLSFDSNADFSLKRKREEIQEARQSDVH